MTYKILIVDDSKLARMSVAKVLNALEPEWTRLEAANADEAVALFESEHPDVVLMDFNMPGRDGLELASELHKLDPKIPLGVISANIQIEIVEKTRAIGAQFLAKPLTEEAFSGFIKIAKSQLEGTTL